MAVKHSKPTQKRFVNLLSRPRPLLIHSGILSVVLLGFPLVASSSPARLSDARPQILIAQTSSPEFSDAGRPRRRQGGGSRGSCLIADKPPLTALVPSSSTGFTLAQSPSFWFYLPYDLTERHSVEFVLKDSQDNLVHRKTIAGNQTALGIINLRLPTSVVLEKNQTYEWYLLVQCDAENSERFVFVNGAIQRLERPELQQKLATLTLDAHPDLYAAENLWYDALDSVATQLQDVPENNRIRKSWRALLQSVGLTNLESQPILSCCVVE